jgi:hypothetical protein
LMAKWKLSLTIPGASEDEIARGVAAAQQVFDDAGAIPFEAASAIFKRDGEIDDLSEREAWLTGVWDDADTAAQKAAGAKEPFYSGPLELLPIN